MAFEILENCSAGKTLESTLNCVGKGTGWNQLGSDNSTCFCDTKEIYLRKAVFVRAS